MLRLKTAFLFSFLYSRQDQGIPSSLHHNNNNPFVLRFLHENAKRCKACDTDLCHRKRIIPFDLIFAQGTVVLSSEWKLVKPQGFSEGDSLLPHHEAGSVWWHDFHTLIWIMLKFLMMSRPHFVTHTKTTCKRVGPSGWYPGSDTVPKC